MKKKTLMFIIAIASVVNSFAQVTANNELKKLINNSFTYFPQVKEVENVVSTAQQKIELIKTAAMPEASLAVVYDYMQPKIEIPFPLGPGGSLENFLFAPVNNVNAGVSASFILLDFGRLKTYVQKSKDDLQNAQHNVESVKNQLAYQVANIYYNIIFFKKAIIIEDSVLKFLNDNRDVTESKLKNGDALKVDLLNIQANIDAEQNRKVDLQNSLQKQYNLLQYTTGLQQNNGADFDFDIALIDTATALSTATANNLDFVLAKDKVTQSQNDLAITKLTTRPLVSTHASVGYKNGYVPDVNVIQFNYLAGISLNVPIYTGGRNKQQIKVQENLIKQNKLAVETLSSTYQKDINQTITDIKSNYERIKNTKGQIEQAVYAEQLAAIRYQEGVGTNLELTNASTNVQRAKFTKLQYEYQLCLAKLEWARLMGYKYW
jgi:outer membrane protein TolC